MIQTEAQQRQAVVAEARTWEGTPWHHQGRVKGAGVDCLMLIAGVFEAAGLVPHLAIVPDPEQLTAAPQASGPIFVPNYPPDWHLHRSEELAQGIVERFAREIPGPPLPGDVGLCQYGRVLSHGFIVLDWPLILHAVTGGTVQRADGRQIVIRGKRPLRTVFYSYWGRE